MTANASSPATNDTTMFAPRRATAANSTAKAAVARTPTIEPSAAFAAKSGPRSRNRKSVIGPDVNGMPTSQPLIA